MNFQSEDLIKANNTNSDYENLRAGSDFLFCNSEKCGKNQDAFYYQLVDPANNGEEPNMRITFYGGTKVSILFCTDTI